MRLEVGILVAMLVRLDLGILVGLEVGILVGGQEKLPHAQR